MALADVLWAVLLGVAVGAALGVLVAAAGRRRNDVKVARSAYLSSFRYVLSDDADAAIEELTRVAAITPQSVEAWFALGALFRRKGDVGRAIRVHQHLLQRTGLEPAVRRAAAFELALDFRRSGLTARATQELQRLVDEEPQHAEAFRELRELHEQAGDWPRALQAQERLAALGQASPSVSAHLFAAKARVALQQRELDVAERDVSDALTADPRSADALAARGELLLQRGNVAEAVRAFSAAVREDADALPLVLARATVADMASDGLGRICAERLGEAPDDALVRMLLARHLRARGLEAEAAGELRRLLELRPELAEAQRELSLLLVAGLSEDARKVQLEALLRSLSRADRPFACAKCHVALADPAFRCPRCHAWDAVKRSDPRAP